MCDLSYLSSSHQVRIIAYLSNHKRLLEIELYYNQVRIMPKKGCILHIC